ncbi:MAG: hypothetical protein KDK99_05580 [Verrucomicrobiales bacterium]|nr:hypothetical protein [Verrucomicrobiales bacterium]
MSHFSDQGTGKGNVRHPGAYRDDEEDFNPRIAVTTPLRSEEAGENGKSLSLRRVPDLLAGLCFAP